MSKPILDDEDIFAELVQLPPKTDETDEIHEIYKSLAEKMPEVSSETLFQGAFEIWNIRHREPPNYQNFNLLLEVLQRARL